MKELIRSVIDLLKSGSDAVLVSVTASSGSTPRGAGAMMLVRRDGSSAGTIGGGRVEYEAQLHAAEIYSAGRSGTVGYNLAPNDVADLGMICGGKVTVYFQYIPAGDAQTLELFSYLAGAFERGENVWFVRRMANGEITDMGAYGSSGLLFAPNIPESDIRPLLKSRAVLSGNYYVEPLVMAGHVYVFGGGHVAQQLVPVLAKIGFPVVVYEDRPEFATSELFPAAQEIICADLGRISEHITVGPADYVVIMTRGHQKDYEVLEQMLRTPATYVGCIGSRSKVAATKERLAAAGVSQADIDRMVSPIGLEIEAETPEEIAISIAAQLILHRAQRAQ